MGLFCCHRFVLSSTESSSGAKAVIHSSGLATEAVASGLEPFTQYTAVLQASDADACLLLLWIWAKINKVFPPSSQPYFIVRCRLFIENEHCSLNWQGCVRVYRCAPPAAALPHRLCHSWLPQPRRRTSPHPPSLQQGRIRWMSPGSLPQSRTVTLRFGLKLVFGKRLRKTFTALVKSGNINLL